MGLGESFHQDCASLQVTNDWPQLHMWTGLAMHPLCAWYTSRFKSQEDTMLLVLHMLLLNL